MKSLAYNYFGKIEFHLDGTEIALPYLSSVKVLILLILRKQLKRDDISGIVWPSKDMETSRKSLRNAIYEIRKKFYPEMILNRGRELLELDGSLTLCSDIESILKTGYDVLDIGEVMRKTGLPVMDQLMEDECMQEIIGPHITGMLDELLQYLMNALDYYIEENISIKVMECFKCIKNLNSIQEEAYEKVIEWQIKNNRYFEAAEQFKNLEHLLKQELGCEPSAKLVERFNYKESISRLKPLKTREEYYNSLVSRIMIEVNRFYYGENYKHIILKALPGTGRHHVLERLRIQLPEEMQLISINRMSLNQLELDKLKDGSGLILFNASGIQKCDEYSGLYEFIRSRKNFMTIAYSMNSDIAEQNCVVSEMLRGGEIMSLELSLSSDEEITAAIDESKVTIELSEAIHQTGRRPILVEYLTGSVSEEEIRKFFGKQIKELDDEKKQMIQIISLLEGDVPLNELSVLLGMARPTMIDALADLENLGLINLIRSENGPGVQLFSEVFKKYIAGGIDGVKRLKHFESIAGGYEKLFGIGRNKDYSKIEKVISSYKSAGNTERELLFRLQYITMLSNIFHEFFPILRDKNLEQLETRYLDPVAFLTEYNDIRASMIVQKIHLTQEAELSFEYIYARYLKTIEIRTYITNVLTRLLDKVAFLDDTDRVFEILIQIIQNSFNTQNFNLFKLVMDEIEKKFIKYINEEQYAVLLRYRAYLESVRGRTAPAVSSVNKAIGLFESFNNPHRYTFAFVACYYYLGEIYRRSGDYRMAEECYSNTLEYINDDISHPSIAIILSRLGIVNYELGNRIESMYYLERAEKQYEMLGCVWGREETKRYLMRLKSELKLT